MEVSELERKSIQYRRSLLRAVKEARAGHTGGDLSCIDILNALYNGVMNASPENATHPDRDRYVQSKGHAVEALYVVLADKGFFQASELLTLGRYGSPFIGHPTRDVPGIEHNTGALGHGLSVGVGMALAGKRDNRTYRVYVLMGDGELAEGSVWEAALSAAHYHLDNLVVIIDRNGLQISGATEQVMSLEPLAAKFAAFGFGVCEVDGHDLKVLVDTLRTAPFEPGHPSVIVARTVKGKGISFMENQVGWHHRVPSDEELARAMAELQQAENDWQERYGTIATTQVKPASLR